MEVQWYPGQMAKAKRLVRENLKLVDAIIEVLDARIPKSSRNPDIRDLLAAKPVVAVLTRIDLADPSTTTRWQHALRKDYWGVAAVNANTGDGIKKLLHLLTELPKGTKSGKRPVRLLVVGVPNVGKSSLINRLTGRSPTVTGDKPGVTKNKQWIRVHEHLEILDTPGMLWPRITSTQQAFSLAAVGSVKDEILDPVQLGAELVAYLSEHNSDSLQERYNLETLSTDAREVLTQIGRKRGCLVKGGDVEIGRASCRERV